MIGYLTNINTIRMDSVISAARFDVVVVVSDEVSNGGDDQRIDWSLGKCVIVGS